MITLCEGYIFDVIKGTKKGCFAALIKSVLTLFSWFWGLSVTLKSTAIERGWIGKYTAPVPLVVSIGNVTVGGTGKTPLTLLVTKQFHQDFLVAILSRGYRSPAEHLTNPLKLCDRQGPEFPASYCGDESYLMAKKLHNGLIFVGKDRCRSAYMAAKAGAQLILLDDGMQYRKLARDLEVVVVDVCDPLGSGRLLPRGLLRERPRALSRADLIVINSVEDGDQIQSVKEKLKPYTSSPVVGVQPKAVSFRQGEQEVSSLEGAKVGLFCGIGNPERFFKTVSRLGVEIVAEKYSPDHRIPTIEGLYEFGNHCAKEGAQYLVCTEKDWVKMDPSKELPLPVIWIEIELKVVVGEAVWNDFIQQIKERLEKYQVAS